MKFNDFARLRKLAEGGDFSAQWELDRVRKRNNREKQSGHATISVVEADGMAVDLGDAYIHVKPYNARYCVLAAQTEENRLYVTYVTLDGYPVGPAPSMEVTLTYPGGQVIKFDAVNPDCKDTKP